MVRWLAVVGAAMAAVATARKRGEARYDVSVDSNRLRPWLGRALVEVERGKTTWGSSGGSRDEEDRQDVEITLPSGWDTGSATSGEAFAGNAQGDEGDVVAAATAEEKDAEDRDAATALDTDVSPGAITSGTSSAVGQTTRNDAASETVDAVHATSVPVGSDIVEIDPLKSTPAATVDTSALPSTILEANDGDEGLVPEEQVDIPASSLPARVGDSTVLPDDPIDAPSENQGSGGELRTETPATLDASASLVSASATNNHGISQPEPTTTPETDSPGTTDASTTSIPSEPTIIKTPTDSPSTDGPITSESSTGTPAPSTATPSTTSTNPVLEPGTAMPTATDPEMDSDGTGGTTVNSDNTATEQPASNLATSAPLMVDAPLAQDSPAPGETDGGSVWDTKTDSNNTGTKLLASDLATSAPSPSDVPPTQDSPVLEGMGDEPPRDTKTDSNGSVTKQPTSDLAAPAPLTAGAPSTQDSPARVRDAETNSNDTETTQSTSNLGAPTPLATGALPTQDSPAPEVTQDQSTRGQDGPADEPLSSPPVEKTEAPAAAATPVSKTESSPPIVDVGHDTTDLPQAAGTSASHVVDNESQSSSDDTGNEATSPGSSGHAHSSASDFEVPVPATDAPETSHGVVSAPTQPARDEPATAIEKVQSQVTEDVSNGADEEGPAKEVPSGDNKDLPAVTESPHTAVAETRDVLVEEPLVGTHGGSRVVVDADAPIGTATTANGGDDASVGTASTTNGGHSVLSDAATTSNGTNSVPVDTATAANNGNNVPSDSATTANDGDSVPAVAATAANSGGNVLVGAETAANDSDNVTADATATTNDGDSIEGEDTVAKSNGNTRKEDKHDDNNDNGGNDSVDGTVAEAASNGATPASDADKPSMPASNSDSEPVDLASTEASSPTIVTAELPSPVEAELPTSHGVGTGTSETTTAIAEEEADSEGIPGTISSLAVEMTDDEADAPLPMATVSGNVALTIPEESSGSTGRTSSDLRAQLSTASTLAATSDEEESRSETEVDESDGVLSTGSPASVISIRTIAPAPSVSNTSDISTSAKAVSLGLTSASAVLPTSGESKAESTVLSKSDEPKVTLSAELLTVDTVSAATNLAVASATTSVAELTGSGALLLADGATAEAYVRGQTSINSGLVATDSGEAALLSGAPDAASDGEAHIIGGRKSRVGSASSGLYVSSSTFQNAVRYITCVASVLSVALLVGFHFVYLDDRLRWPTHSPGTYWSPNAWEFVVYTGYLQQTMALSPMTLMQTPYFLWEFTDIFAWSNLLVYKSPNPASSDGRRLDIIILNSLVGYADRIGADEASLIFRVDAGFAVVIVAVLALATVLYGVDKWRGNADTSNNTDRKPRASCARRLLGLCVLLWFFSLFPLTLVGSFEVAMEMQASVYSSGPLVLAMVAVVAISAGGLAIAARSVLHKSSSGLRQPKTRALWGALYEDHKHSARLFFVFTAALQIVTGLAIGAMRTSKTLLVLLLVIHGTYLLALFACAPFTARAALAQRFAYAATTAKLLNVVMAFAFLEAIPLSVNARCRVARAFIAMNALILVMWFLRHLVLFCTCVVVMSSRDGDDVDIQPPVDDGGRSDIVRLECGSAQQIQVSYRRVSLAPNAAGGSQTTPSHCDWQSSTTPMTAIL